MRKLSNEGFTAAFKNMIKTPQFMASAAGAAIGLGARRLEDHFHSKRIQQQKTMAYKEMLDLHPHLRQRDPGEVSRIYNSLHNVSPNMARDPMVAGAWVDQIVETKVPGMNSHQALLNAVKDLSGIQKNVADTERSMRPEYSISRNLQGGITEVGKLWEHGQDRMRTLQRDNVTAYMQEQNKLLGEAKAKAIASDRIRQKRIEEGGTQLNKDRELLAGAAANLREREERVRQQESMFAQAFDATRKGVVTPHTAEKGHAGFAPRPGIVPNQPPRKTASAHDLRSMLQALRV